MSAILKFTEKQKGISSISHVIAGLVLEFDIPYAHAIITRGLNILSPFFEGQKRFFKEVFSQNSALMYTMRTNLLNLVSSVKNVVFYAFGVVRIY